MKFVSFKTFVFLVAFGSCSSVQTKDRREADFNFSLEYGVFSKCHVSIIDTENMTYTRKDTKEGDVSIELPLTELQIDTVRQMMDKMKFYDYPEFNLESSSTVSTIYTFKVKNGALKKLLKFETDGLNNTSALETLCQYITSSIRVNPKVKNLPDWKTLICH